jgi:hypothetical protein
MPVRASHICSGNALTGSVAGRRHRGECRAQDRKDLRCSAAACRLSLTRQTGAAKPGLAHLCASKHNITADARIARAYYKITPSALAFHAQRVTAPRRRAHQSRRRLASNAGHQRRPKTGLLSARKQMAMSGYGFSVFKVRESHPTTRSPHQLSEDFVPMLPADVRDTSS